MARRRVAAFALMCLVLFVGLLEMLACGYVSVRFKASSLTPKEAIYFY